MAMPYPLFGRSPVLWQRQLTDRQTPSALMTLHPVWDTVPVERVQEWPKPDSRITIVGDAGPKNSSALEQLLPHAQSLRFQPEDTIEEIARRLADGGMPEHIVWIAPDAAEGSLPGVSLTRAQQAGVFQLFKLIKAVLLAGGGGSKTGWTVITGHTQSVGRRDDVDAAHAGVHGLIGSLAKEYPNWSVRLIDLESGGQWPLQELLSLPADRQGNAWAYRSGEWFRQKLIPVNRSNNNTPERILYRKGGVYVVIGGAGGIGEVWSEYMIRTWQAHIVWIGRREKDELIQAKLDRLGAFGEAPVYISGDASDRSSLQLAYDAAKKRFGRIDGVVHSAIVLADQSLANMDEARFRSALVAKVDTSVNMAELLAGETPDFVLFFSSMNAFMKSAGQSNYAAGCTFMDAYAHQLAARSPYPVKTMNWGYWGGVGVVASDAYQERMAQMGIGSIEPEEAMEALGGLLSGPLNQLALLKTTGGLTIEGISQDEQLFLHPDNSVQSAEQLASVLPDPATAAAGLTGKDMRRFKIWSHSSAGCSKGSCLRPACSAGQRTIPATCRETAYMAGIQDGLMRVLRCLESERVCSKTAPARGCIQPMPGWRRCGPTGTAKRRNGSPSAEWRHRLRSRRRRCVHCRIFYRASFRQRM